MNELPGYDAWKSTPDDVAAVCAQCGEVIRGGQALVFNPPLLRKHQDDVFCSPECVQEWVDAHDGELADLASYEHV